jgi:hypothetical protein
VIPHCIAVGWGRVARLTSAMIIDGDLEERQSLPALPLPMSLSPAPVTPSYSVLRTPSTRTQSQFCGSRMACPGL